MFDVDSSIPVETTPSKALPSKSTMPALSQLSPRVPTNIIENEYLAWEHFKKVVSSEDITTCYDMSLKDFEHSGVHDLFKAIAFYLICYFIILSCLTIISYFTLISAMSKFIAASRQATELDKMRILLEMRVQGFKR